MDCWILKIWGLNCYNLLAQAAFFNPVEIKNLIFTICSGSKQGGGREH
uniref:Uncharacterized protein n=1 Tax=Arundo donax TaxID=35708 RepID=A0A0A9GYZ6_ARUDO